MDSNGSGRRRFLKHAAALAGVGVGAGAGAEWGARGQSAKSGASAKPEVQAEDANDHRELLRRGARFSVDHITYYTPLQDYAGIITPAQLHFVQYHASHFPDIDAQQHRLTIHGMVDRPLSFSMEDLKRLPSVSLNEVGVQKEGPWLVSEGADPGKFSHPLPLAKGMEDVLVAYGQNGEPLRVEQGYPIRLLVPGWEA